MDQNLKRLMNLLKGETIPTQVFKPEHGQILISNNESKGAIEVIHELKGKRIVNISGDQRKLFLFEEISEAENAVIALHAESEDYLEFNGQEVLPIGDVVTALEGNKIVTIKNGREHSIILTYEGHLYAYGKGNFGSLGLGGTIFAPQPRLITKLENKKIVSVACGVYHTLALSSIGDVFSWGRGFEGQLGLLNNVETVSVPHFIPHFFKYDNESKEIKMLKKNPIHVIACGSFHSIAIDRKGDVYCWGEAMYGQTGNNKKVKEPIPVKVNIEVEGQKRKAKAVAGGFGHTLCLTEEGEIFSWGLNNKGQLGMCDMPPSKDKKISENNNDQIPYVKANYYPYFVEKSRSSERLPQFKSIACGYFRSFAIDLDGNAWGWGGGNLGFKEKYSERGPIQLTEAVENKKFTKILANEDSLVLFAPFSPSFFKPILAPSRGGTELTFFGTGFCDTGAQSVRFKIGEHCEDLQLFLDPKTDTFFCKLPCFQQLKGIEYPTFCSIEISLDRENFIPYQKNLLVYSSSLAMETFEPKFGSVIGGSELKIFMPLSSTILDYVESITVGFKNNPGSQGEIKAQDWICTQGLYSEEKIVCKMPNISHFNSDHPFYLVDISLNGEEFTDSPQTIRFYFLTELALTPNQGETTGQYEVKLSGKGLFDTPFKQLKLKLAFQLQDVKYDCDRNVDLKWNKADRCFTFTMPSLEWVVGDHPITPELLEEAQKSPVSVVYYVCDRDPVEVGKFKFVAPPPPPPPEEEPDKKGSKKDSKKGGKK